MIGLTVLAVFVPVAFAGRIQHRQLNTDSCTIDTHAHFTPDFFRDLLGGNLVGGNPTPAWNISMTFDAMRQQNISRTILTPSYPQTQLNNRTLTVNTAMRLNDYAANLSRTYPNNISWFGVLPLPYINDTLQEIQRIRSLGALGYAIYSNAEGVYVGNASYKPVFEALNGLNATIFVHPQSPSIDCGAGGRVGANPLGESVIPIAALEYFADTARGFTSLFLGGYPQNYTSLRFIFPHVGGDIPAILERVIPYLTRLSAAPTTAAQIYSILRSRMWFDSAGPSYPQQVGGIRGYSVPWSQFLLGTDFPSVALAVAVPNTAAVKNYTFPTAQDRDNVLCGNARRLFGSI